MAAAMYHAFVGAETGLLKGVNFEEKNVTNVNSLSSLKRDHEIQAMCWTDIDQTQILMGLKNRAVCQYDTTTHNIANLFETQNGGGDTVGIAAVDGSVILCNRSGIVSTWDSTGKIKDQFHVGTDIYKMRVNPKNPHVIGTGGKENELKIWDLNDSKNPVFTAKNVPHDFLNLRVPVWVCDLQFVANSQQIITCTGYHQVRLYDPCTSQRRPVINVEFDNFPLIAMAVVPGDTSVVVGNTHGKMALIDIRKPGRFVHCYKGAIAGSIRCIQCHPEKDIVASCGLDRFLRVHDTKTRKLLHKVYLKSRLNCLLLKNIPDSIQGVHKEANLGYQAVTENTTSQADEIWDSMPVVTDENLQRFSKLKSTKQKRERKRLKTN